MTNPENIWPGGRRKALDQAEHEAWNAKNHPGTLQLCGMCGNPTGRCQEDELLLADLIVCQDCYDEAGT